MEISEKEIAEIERAAAAAYSPKEVAFILGFSPAEFAALVKDEESAVSAAYYKGLYSSELAVRESIMTLARNASSPAQTLANNLFNDNRRNLIKSGISAIDES